MQELQKLHRVMGKQLPGAPHEVLLVLDATTGMNALNQAREFHKAVPLTGLVVTKLDGTSKGGMVVAIQKELACRSNLSAWANRRMICSPSMPNNSPRRCSKVEDMVKPWIADVMRRRCAWRGAGTDRLHPTRWSAPCWLRAAELSAVAGIIERGTHAEIGGLRDAANAETITQGATLYVTLEPCSTQGRTPPCTDAITEGRDQKVVVGATDPNPHHRGKGLELLNTKASWLRR